jgi:hypothetical protein
MAKTGLEANLVGHVTAALEARRARDASFDQKAYITALKKLAKDIDAANKASMTDPEFGISVSRICFQFTLLAMPDPAQESGRATSLSQCQTLEDLLSKVRKPGQYLAEMQKQFGPDLDPRNYPASQDAFNSIIKSQKNRIYQESKGLNTHAEQVFCRKRTDLLTEVEKGYNQLRDNALGIDKSQDKGRGR